MNKNNRRSALKNMGALSGMAIMNPSFSHSKVIHRTESKNAIGKVLYCLNSSTIRGQKLSLDKEIELASKAGYDGLELWIPVLNEYKKSGKSLKDLNKKIKDLGLKVFDGIGFAQWIHDDDTARKNALEQAKQEMQMMAELDCHRIAAPPAGATDHEINYDVVADRFKALQEIGIQQGVIPQLELWGFSKTLYKLSQVMYVATQCGIPQTRILLDSFHLFKGGSHPDALKLIGAEAIEIFHVNDYSSTAQRSTITDADRIYPSDGAAPYNTIIKDLTANRPQVILSLELFNAEYYKQDAATVLKTGIEKVKAVVKKALG